MKIGNDIADLEYEIFASDKEKETAEKISDLLDGFTIGEVDHILHHVRRNYRNATYKKEFLT